MGWRGEGLIEYLTYSLLKYRQIPKYKPSPISLCNAPL